MWQKDGRKAAPLGGKQHWNLAQEKQNAPNAWQSFLMAHLIVLSL